MKDNDQIFFFFKGVLCFHWMLGITSYCSGEREGVKTIKESGERR